METKQFISISKEGENSQIEYKTCYDQISYSLYESVCSFLNHNGGYILIGVNDKGKIIGLNPDKIQNLRNNIITTVKNKDLFMPTIYLTPEVVYVEDKVVMALHVPCGQYVYRYNGRYFDRNEEVDIDITDHPELLLALFERKNPHIFEERFVDGLTMDDIDHQTFQFCRNILSVNKPNHSWLQLSDEDILIHLHLAKRDSMTKKLRIKYAALILFGKEASIQEFIPRYRFEALFHMCTYQQYFDLNSMSNRYDDRRSLRCNLIMVYNELTKFTERYLPDKFYLPAGTTQRIDLRWNLFREIIANMCVHSDYSSGYACFYHVFKDRVMTKNPSRLLPEIPEGKVKLEQLNNYTKNPLLVKVFHELSWVEDMGSGTRNILRYAPLYNSSYKVEILNGSHFIFSITYVKMSLQNNENVLTNQKMSPENNENVLTNQKMSPQNDENVLTNQKMSLENDGNVLTNQKMSPENDENVLTNLKMSPENDGNVPTNQEMSPENDIKDLESDELDIRLDYIPTKRLKNKEYKRHLQIVELIIANPQITIDEISEKLKVNERTIRRDIDKLSSIIEHVGPNKGGYWKVNK